MKKLFLFVLIASMLCPTLLLAEVRVQVIDGTNQCPYEGCTAVANVNDGFNWNATWGPTDGNGNWFNYTDEGEAFDYWVAAIAVPDGYTIGSGVTSVQVDFDTMGYTYVFVIWVDE